MLYTGSVETSPIAILRTGIPYILHVIKVSSIFLLKKGTVWEPLSAPALSCLRNSHSLTSNMRDYPFPSALLSQSAFETFCTRCCSYAEPIGQCYLIASVGCAVLCLARL